MMMRGTSVLYGDALLFLHTLRNGQTGLQMVRQSSSRPSAGCCGVIEVLFILLRRGGNFDFS